MLYLQLMLSAHAPPGVSTDGAVSRNETHGHSDAVERRNKGKLDKNKQKSPDSQDADIQWHHATGSVRSRVRLLTSERGFWGSHSPDRRDAPARPRTHPRHPRHGNTAGAVSANRDTAAAPWKDCGQPSLEGGR
ncbi:hypothetical protein GJAV_G00243720 [Gymnothorax javanicus]|nr:hypothetical protein GJAV_G00243720 [Gymnothorax javanicus]